MTASMDAGGFNAFGISITMADGLVTIRSENVIEKAVDGSQHGFVEDDFIRGKGTARNSLLGLVDQIGLDGVEVDLITACAPVEFAEKPLGNAGIGQHCRDHVVRICGKFNFHKRISWLFCKRGDGA